MRPPGTQHLLTVWNPALGPDAIQEHARVLLRQLGIPRREPAAARVVRELSGAGEIAEALRVAAGTASGRGERAPGEAAEAAEPYVWWARLYRPRALTEARARAIAAVRRQIAQGLETHLYITDYYSLYVGDLRGILTYLDEPEFSRVWRKDSGHRPTYYGKLSREALPSFLFRLADLRVLTTDRHELARVVANLLYPDRDHEISIYHSDLFFPMVVRERRPLTFFGAGAMAATAEREGTRRWVERIVVDRRSLQVGEDLRENHFGALWDRFEFTTRYALATAERLYRRERSEPGFDFALPCLDYAKAVEVEFNAKIWLRVRREVPEAMLGKALGPKEGRRWAWIDLGGIQALLRLPEVQRALGGGRGRGYEEAMRLAALGVAIRELAEVRNKGAHREAVDLPALQQVRSAVLGLGRPGILAGLVAAGGG